NPPSCTDRRVKENPPYIAARPTISCVLGWVRDPIPTVHGVVFAIFAPDLASGGPDVLQEGVDLGAQYVGFAAERAGGGQHFGGGGSGLGRRRGDADDVAGNLAG